MKKRKFKGKLAERVDPRRVGLLSTEEYAKKQFAKWTDEDREKLLLLCDEFGVKTNNFMFENLALALAREYVPGFQEKRKTGTKTKWTQWRLGMLVVELERIREDRGCSVLDAASILSRLEPWASFSKARESHLTPDKAMSLKKQYDMFKGNKWAIACRGAFKYRVVMETVDEWDAELIEHWDYEIDE